MVYGALSKGVVAIARNVSVDPSVVLTVGDVIVMKAIEEGKKQAMTRIPKAMASASPPKPSGGTELATPLATYNSALDESLDGDAEGLKKSTLQELLNLQPEPAGLRWAVAAALYEAIHETREAAKRAQWNATSDGWFGMQTASGVGTFSDVDQGIVSIMLRKDFYPTDSISAATGAYLGGEGANDATVSKYNNRKLGEILLPKRLIMENGSMGHGLVECGFEVAVPLDRDPIFHSLSRWGLPWLAAKHLGLRNIDTNSEQINYENVHAGAEAVWAELKGKSASDLGAHFEVTGVTSGTGAAHGSDFTPPRQPGIYAAP
jgi:hypothetical protein